MADRLEGVVRDARLPLLILVGPDGLRAGCIVQPDGIDRETRAAVCEAPIRYARFEPPAFGSLGSYSHIVRQPEE